MDHPAPSTIEERLTTIMLRDRRRLERITGERFDAELARAEAVVAARAASMPTISYPESLPITGRADELRAAIRDHQVVIVAGETGSGKSTQIPKLCMELGRGIRGLIGHTQPRRVAARTIAQRVADELATRLGDTVGYAVRFNDRVSERSLVKVMTDGILLAEIQRDRDLMAYDTLIIDEAHERSLNIDFLLGYLTQLLPRRPDLKLIVTSATIDTDRFAEHFSAAVGVVPVITVEGRTFPVEMRYRPFGPDNADDPADDRDQVQAVCDAVLELTAQDRGDVLVFLSGEREIHDTADALRRMVAAGEMRHTDVFPLYARLSSAEQQRIFEQHTGRRVVLATNVAETSLTVPGVRYVVDTGTARISRYNTRLKVQRLPIEPVSQASANQRAGRCGRVAPGICIRLYSQDDFDGREAFTEPEILRTNLASVILQMTALGLGDVAAFPFIEPPDHRAVRDGVLLLEELGALHPDDADSNRRLTSLGRQLARLPVDPRLGRMVLEADRLGCVREVLVIAAALSIQDPRERPQEQRGTADESHARFTASGSDFVAFVALWDHLREQQKQLSSNQFRKLCRGEFLNYLRVREWQDLYSQLKQVTGQLGIHLGAESGHPDKLHQALLTGLVSQLGMRDGETREFRGARNARFVIAPGSAVAKRAPRWVMVAELVETSRLFGRVAAAVEPEWAERIVPHLVSYSYGEARWDERSGRAVTTERASLYGLPIVAGRTIGVDRVNPELAREMFIRHALVEGDWRSNHRFIASNRQLIEELVELEERARRRDVMVGSEAIFQFYDRRLPPGIASGRHFDRWWKDAKADRPDLLSMTKEVLIADGIRLPTAEEYPGTWRQEDLELPMTYLFAPGDPADGATVHIPLAVLNRVRSEGFEWHVPGFREDLVAELFRTLGKQVRRQLVPAGEYADKAMWDLQPNSGEPLLTQVARSAQLLSGHPVRPGDFDLTRLAPHLRLSFAVIGGHGRMVGFGKDVDVLRSEFSGAARAALAAAAGAGLERSGLTTWNVGALPRSVDVERDGHRIVAYPTLVDDGDSVSVRVVTNQDLQTRAMRAGTRRLLLLTSTGSRKVLQSRITNALTLLCTAAGYSIDALIDDCQSAACDELMGPAADQVWDAAAYEAVRDRVRGAIGARAGELLVSASRSLQSAAALRTRLERLVAPALQPNVRDAEAHLSRLVRPGFVAIAGAGRLVDIERYIEGIDRRLDKLEDGHRDAQRLADVHRYEDRYRRALARLGRRVPAEVTGLGWLLEEYRVSVFAQMLGTRATVSARRIERALTEVEDS